MLWYNYLMLIASGTAHVDNLKKYTSIYSFINV